MTSRRGFLGGCIAILSTNIIAPSGAAVILRPIHTRILPDGDGMHYCGFSRWLQFGRARGFAVAGGGAEILYEDPAGRSGVLSEKAV